MKAVALAQDGVRIATYGDMVRVSGQRRLAGGRPGRRRAHRRRLQRRAGGGDRPRHGRADRVLRTGFETTAVATAAVVLAGMPPNLSVLSAHKFIPPVMEIVAEMPGTRVEGFLAAAIAATITGCGIFEAFAARQRVPVVVAGFEPLDILAALVRLVELVRDRQPAVVNMFPAVCYARRQRQCLESAMDRIPNHRRTVARDCARPQWEPAAALTCGHRSTRGGVSVSIPPGCGSRRRRRSSGSASAETSWPALRRRPTARSSEIRVCRMRPSARAMVSSEGTCRIWHEYGGVPRLGGLACPM
jgi:hydrogenase expression/formation protein HypD